ncbi:MAG: DUF2059 domain-containing protein [Bryobacteraceae bacterium]|jgi:hypothetical protein
MFLARIIVVLALFIPAGLAADQDKRALAEEVLTLTHPEKMIDQIMDQMSNMVHQQMQGMNVPDDKKALVDQVAQEEMSYIREKLDWAKLKPAYVDIYADIFTEEELRQVADFYKSPGGQAFLNKMPQVVQRSMTMAQGLMADLPSHLEEMTNKLKKQLEEQDKPKP